MISEKTKKNAGFLQIIMILKSLRDSGIITCAEYAKAQAYYAKVIGADIILI